MGQTYEQTVTTRSISGNIFYPNDQAPAERVNVELRAPTGKHLASTVTGWGGGFYFADLAPGEYLISVRDPGCEPLSQKVQVALAPRHVTLQLQGTCGTHAYVASVRQLSIDPQARIALRDGIKLLQKDDIPRGMASLQRAIALFPGYYEAYYVLGVANLMLVRQRDAEDAFRRSIALSEGGYARPLFALGSVLCDQKKFLEAESVIRQGLQLDDTPWIGHYTLARALFSLGRWAEAEKTANEALLRQPGLADAYLLLANIHLRQNNTTALLGDLEEFLKLEPDGDLSAQVRKLREDLWQYDQSEQESSATPASP
jgi:tetratricopeptide (TPR) repeat protein